MNNHFCVLVLFDYLCDVDHESESNTQINNIKLRALKQIPGKSRARG